MIETVMYEDFLQENPNAVWVEPVTGQPRWVDLNVDDEDATEPDFQPERDSDGNIVWEVEPADGYWKDVRDDSVLESDVSVYKLKHTRRFRDDSTTDNLIPHNDEDNEPSYMVEKYDDEGNYVHTMVHWFHKDGLLYRTDGPTVVDGGETGITAEYMWNNTEMDVALQIALAKGQITQATYDAEIEKYNNLPTAVPPDFNQQFLGRSADHNLPFKDDVASIVGVLDGTKE